MLASDIKVSPILAPKIWRHRTGLRSEYFEPRLPRQLLKYFCGRASFSKPTEIEVGKSKEPPETDVFLMAEKRGYFRVLCAACGRVISPGTKAGATQSRVCAVVVKKYNSVLLQCGHLVPRVKLVRSTGSATVRRFSLTYSQMTFCEEKTALEMERWFWGANVQRQRSRLGRVASQRVMRVKD